MNLRKKLVIALFLFFLPLNTYSLENKILFKVNDKIITSVDILNETKYLGLINKKFENLDQFQKYEIAKNSIIKERIKENELKKNFRELKIEEEYLKEVEIHSLNGHDSEVPHYFEMAYVELFCKNDKSLMFHDFKTYGSF